MKSEFEHKIVEKPGATSERHSSRMIIGGVTVIVPTFNSVVSTMEALGTVQRQTFSDWEVIVIDDGSSHDNQTALHRLIQDLSDPRINLVATRENNGVAFARNLGIAQASKRFIAFLDCDDLWLPEKLEKQIAFMDQQKSVFSFTNYENRNDDTGKSTIRNVKSIVTYNSLKTWNVIGNSTVILDAEKLILPQIPNLRRRQDFAYWLKILGNDNIAHGLPEVLTIRRLRHGSLSSNKLVAALDTWKMYRYGLDMSLVRSSLYFLAYLANGILQKVFRKLPS